MNHIPRPKESSPFWELLSLRDYYLPVFFGGQKTSKWVNGRAQKVRGNTLPQNVILKYVLIFAWVGLKLYLNKI